MRLRFVLVLVVVLPTTLTAQQNFNKYDFKKSDSVAALYTGHPLMNLDILADKLTRPFSADVEKFRALYTWVCLNIENDYDLYRKAERVRKKLAGRPKELEKWNRNLSARVFRNLMDNRRTVCSGYAYLIKELATRAGLSCEIIGGYGRTAVANIGGEGVQNHSWNAIQLNGKWYLCDATWSSGAIDLSSGKFLQKYDDSYFLAEPSIFVRNHYPLDTSWLLMKDKPTLHEFLNRPVIYKDIYHYGIGQLQPDTFTIKATRGDTVSFCFRSSTTVTINKYELWTKRGLSDHDAVYKNPEGLTCLDHVFRSKGTYIVHGRIDDRNVFTYTVSIQD